MRSEVWVVQFAAVQDPPVELTQPEWWVGLPNRGGPALMDSIRVPSQQHLLQLMQQQSLSRSVDAVEVRESATEVYCMQATAPTQQQHHISIPQGQERAYSAASAGNYPVSSRGSSNSCSQVPGFFGHLHLGKGDKETANGWGPVPSTDPSSRGVSGERQKT